MSTVTAPIRVLGGVRLEGPTCRISVGGPLAERLLGLLVAAGGRALESDAITEVLWPGRSDRDGPPPLRMAASRLRRQLAAAGVEGALEGRRSTYRLAVPAEKVDAEHFATLVGTARHLAPSDPDRAAALLEGALALWKGEPFGALSEEPWAVAHAARLTEQRLSAEEELSELELVRQREVVAVHRLRYLAETEPLRERRWAQLATALYRLGRQAEALRSIERARSVLRDLGLDPGPELRAVERALLVHDPSLWTSTSPVRTSAGASAPALVGRDADTDALRRLLDANRVVTVHGLGGVGKSALARAAVDGDVGRAVVSVALDGLAEPEAVWFAVASAAGISGAEDPAFLPAAIAGRLGSRPTLLVLDGAEAGADAAAEVCDRLLALAPSVKVLATSRVPLGATGEVRYALDALDVSSPDGSPAAQLFLDRAGLTLEQLDASARATVAQVCERAGGLPLAIELAAASADQHGLEGLATISASTGADALRDALRWSIEVLPEQSTRLLRQASLLPGGMSTAAAAHLAGVGDEGVRRVLAPLVQARLVDVVRGAHPGARYRTHESLRTWVADELSADMARLTGASIVEHLIDLASDVGELEGTPKPATVQAVEAELVNVRHWLHLRTGTEDGLQLAVAMAPAMLQLGLGAECRRWIETHRAATPAADPLVHARAIVAAATVGGFFAASVLDAAELQSAAATAEERGAWRLWLLTQAHLAIARGWSGDATGAVAILEHPVLLARLVELGDPMMEVERDRLLALADAVTGRFDVARRRLGELLPRAREVGGPSSALQILFVRTWLARAVGDMEAAAEDLERARELAATGAARAIQALVGAELAHLARHRGDPTAPMLLIAAIDDLERAGNLRSAAAQRLDLGRWRLEDGDGAGGLSDLRSALPMLLRTDRRAAAVGLAEIAAAISATRQRDGALLALAAQRLMADGMGPAAPVSSERVAEVVRALVSGADQVPADVLSEEDILAIALAGQQ